MKFGYCGKKKVFCSQNLRDYWCCFKRLIRLNRLISFKVEYKLTTKGTKKYNTEGTKKCWLDDFNVGLIYRKRLKGNESKTALSFNYNGK